MIAPDRISSSNLAAPHTSVTLTPSVTASFSSPVRSFFLTCVLGLAVIGLLGCGSGTQDDRPGGWIVQEGALQLQENLRVSGGEGFYFGRIADLAATDEGRIFVVDNQGYHVKVLSPGGALQDTIGTRGEGPGEFQHPLQLALARGDSLYVLDGQDGRVHVFTPGYEFERTFLARSDQGTPINMMIPRGEGADTDRGNLFVYSPGARAVVEENAQMIVRRVSQGGKMGSTLFTTPPYRMASKDLEDGRKLFLYVPFTPYPHYALGPNGGVHYARSDSLTVKVYGPTGQPEQTVQVPFESAPPVTDKEIAEELEGRTRGREQVRTKIPDTKPAFTQFLVDDQGRYWFGRPTANSDSTAWWMAAPEAKWVRTDTLPSKVRILTVQNGHAYGTTTTETGAPALVRYEIQQSD